MDRDHGLHELDREARFADLRGAPRLSLMLRAAKLVAATGEYLCIIRDISLSGVRLRLFHPVPAQTPFALELVNGDRFAIQLKWQSNGHAGFSFVSGIDVEAFILEASPFPKRQLRLRIERDAAISVAGEAFDAQLLDVSQHGAQIATETPLALGQLVKLDSPGMPALYGKVRWRRHGHYGLIFVQTFRLDELARLALALQPFAPTHSGTRIAAGVR